MEYTLSFNEEIDNLMKKKLSVCNCNPCTCAEKKKDIYFQELKDILARFNKENLLLNLMEIQFLINDSQNISKFNY